MASMSWLGPLNICKERQERSDPCWNHGEESLFLPTDLHLLDAELDLLDGVTVDVVADVHLLPLHQLGPDNCKDTMTKTPLRSIWGKANPPSSVSGRSAACVWHAGLGCGLDARSTPVPGAASVSSAATRGRNASGFQRGRKPVSKSLKKRNLNFPPVRRGLPASLSEAAAPS